MKKFVIAFLLSVAAQSVLAQSLVTSLIPVDAQSLALGGIDTGVRMKEGMDVRAGFGMWAPSNAESTVFGLKLSYGMSGRLAAGLELSSIKGRQYNITDDSGFIKDKYSPSDTYFGAFGEMRLDAGFSVGARLKCAISDIGNDASGFAVIGILNGSYKNDALTAGLSLQAGSPIRYGPQSYSTPLLAKADASYSFRSLTGLCELGYEAVSRSFLGSIGAQYALNDVFSARAGYHFGKLIPSFLSLGLGISYRGLGLSAAYLLPGSNIGNTFVITVSCCL